MTELARQQVPVAAVIANSAALPLSWEIIAQQKTCASWHDLATVTCLSVCCSMLVSPTGLIINQGMHAGL